MNSSPLAAVEVVVTMTPATIARIILMLFVIFLIYFILKSRFA